jgi:hypothetical protein
MIRPESFCHHYDTMTLNDSRQVPDADKGLHKTSHRRSVPSRKAKLPVRISPRHQSSSSFGESSLAARDELDGRLWATSAVARRRDGQRVDVALRLEPGPLAGLPKR